jgi:uncharacterized protein (TIGR02996 family)
MHPDEIPDDMAPAPPRIPAPVLPHPGLFQAVLDEPDNDELRLVLADWFEEQGQPERAEFIRVQCALASCSPLAPEWARLSAREQQLLGGSKEPWAQSRREWIAPLQGIHMGWGFRRGFVEEAALSADVLLAKAANLFACAPVRNLRLALAPPLLPAARLPALADLPQLNRITTLTLEGGNPGDGWSLDQAIRLCHSPHLAALHALTLQDSVYRSFGVAGARVLADAPLLSRLQRLYLPEAMLGTDGLCALLQTPGFKVQELNVRGSRTYTGGRDWEERTATSPNIGEAGVILLAQSAAARSLRRLDVALNRIGASGVQALIQSPHLEQIEHLDLYEADESSLSSPPCNVPEEQIQALRHRFGDRVSFGY